MSLDSGGNIAVEVVLGRFSEKTGHFVFSYKYPGQTFGENNNKQRLAGLLFFSKTLHQEAVGHHPHCLHPHPAPHHHLAHDQLLQALLLRGRRHGQLDRDAGPGDHVHLRVREPSQDILHQDGGCLADFQSDGPIL